MATVAPVKVVGLLEFRRSLRAMDRDRAKMIRVALNEASQIVVDAATPPIPFLTGRAKASVKARSTQTEGRVVGGGNRAPHYPWLDFGGRVGRRKSIQRAFLKEGRYIFQGYFDNRDQVLDAAQLGLVDLAESAGLEVT